MAQPGTKLDVNGYIRMFDAAAAQRGTHESTWDDIASNIYPRKSIYTGRSVSKPSYTKVYDGTPLWSQGLLTAYLHSMITNPSSIWCSIVPVDERLLKKMSVRRWMQEVDVFMFRLFLRSNFHSEIHENFADLSTFGNSCLFIEDDEDLVANFSARPLHEVFWMCDSRNKPSTLMRRFQASAYWMLDKFGAASMSEKARKALMDEKKCYSPDFTILHIIREREVWLPGAWDKSKRRYESKYIELDSKHVLEESGYHEQPFVIGRFYVNAGEDIGWGPGEIALPDARSLHMLQKHTIRAVQKATDPAILLPSQAFVGPIDLSSGALNYYNAKGNIASRGAAQLVQPFPQGTNFPTVSDEKNSLRDNVQRNFFVDQLRLRDGDRMTAEEVRKRAEENQRIFSPFMGRIYSEMIEPMARRVFNIAWRKGLIPQPPSELMEHGVDIKIISPLAKLQGIADVQSLVSAIDTVTPLAQTKPDILEMIDGGKFMEFVFKSFGAPLEVLVDPTEFMQALKQKQKQQEELQQLQVGAAAAGDMAGAVKDLGQVGGTQAVLQNMMGNAMSAPGQLQ